MSGNQVLMQLVKTKHIMKLNYYYDILNEYALPSVDALALFAAVALQTLASIHSKRDICLQYVVFCRVLINWNMSGVAG